MPIVRMHIDNAEGLVDAYGAASANAREAMVALSPLVTEAYDLLGMGSQNGLTGPIPALVNLANDLRTEQDDVAWRVDWLKSTDTQPLGPSGRVRAFIPANLAEAFAQIGLTAEEAELVEDMLNEGVSFSDAVAIAQSDNPEAALDAIRLAELNDAITNWDGDNWAALDELLREQRELLDSYLNSGQDIPAEIAALLVPTLSSAQIGELAEVDPGAVQQAFADAGLDPYQAQVAFSYIEAGLDFDDAVAATLQSDADTVRLAELDEQIARWQEIGNHQVVEALSRERQAIIDGYVESGDPIPPTVAVQLLSHLSPQDALAIEQGNPGAIDIGYLNAVIGAHDATFFPGDPIDPEIEHLRDLRDELVGDLTEGVDGPIDWETAAIAQRNGSSYEEAELAIEVNAIDRLNDQAANIPSPEGAAIARDQRDDLILELLGGDELLAASVGRFMSQGNSFAESLGLAEAELAKGIPTLLTEDQYAGDIGGTYSTERRPDFLAPSATGSDAGAFVAIQALDHTADPSRVAQDEFEIVYLENGQAIIVLPGVTDLTSTLGSGVKAVFAPDPVSRNEHIGDFVEGVMWDPNSHTARDTWIAAEESSHSASVSDNVYAQLISDFVAQQIAAGNLAPQSDVMIVGHSFGADTAVDLASDPIFNGELVNVTHVVAAAYHNEPQLDSVQDDTKVVVIQNVHDFAVIVEGTVAQDGDPLAGAIVGGVVEATEAATNVGVAGLNGIAEGSAELFEFGVEGLAGIGNSVIANADPFDTDIEVDFPDIPDAHFTEPRVEQYNENIVISEFYGGMSTDGGHHQDRYSEHIRSAEVPELNEFFASVVDGGYAVSGEAHAVDVSVPEELRG